MLLACENPYLISKVRDQSIQVFAKGIQRGGSVTFHCVLVHYHQVTAAVCHQLKVSEVVVHNVMLNIAICACVRQEIICQCGKAEINDTDGLIGVGKE